MIAFLLGAGFSKWAVNLPTANELFDFDFEPWGPQEVTKLELLRNLKNNWDGKHTEGISEQFIADLLSSSKQNARLVSWYITRRLSERFIWKEFHAQKWRRHVLMIDEHRKFNIPGIKKAQSFLLRLCHPIICTGVITTNYDMIVEYALGTKHFNYGIYNQVLIGRGPYPLAESRFPVTLTGEIPLAKIHGSISWDEKAYYTDGRRGITGNALIVAPTQGKLIPKSMKATWQLAGQILNRAKRLVIFGFSFNPYDEQILGLLRSHGKHLEMVLLIDIMMNFEKAQNIWPNASIRCCLPPPAGKEAIDLWIGVD